MHTLTKIRCVKTHAREKTNLVPAVASGILSIFFCIVGIFCTPLPLCSADGHSVPNNKNTQGNKGIQVPKTIQTPDTIQRPKDIQDQNIREAEEYFRRAIIDRKNCKYDSAIANFTEVIKRLPAKPNAYLGRGHIYMSMNEPLKAITDFNTALKINPQAFQAHFNKGSCFVQADQPDEAIVEYSKCLDFKPRSTIAVNVLLQRGRVYLLKNQPNEAIKDFTRALTLEPNSHLVYLFRGRAYQLSGNHKRAREDLELANLNEESFASSTYSVGIEKVLNEDPKNKAGGKNKITYLSYDDKTRAALEKKDRKDFKGALNDLNAILAKEKNLVVAYIVRGDIYLEMGKYDEAIESFSQAWSRQNMNLDAIHGRAKAYLAKNDPEHALPDINKLIWFDPFCPNYYFEKARTLERLKRNKQASAMYKRFLELAEQNKGDSTMLITKYKVAPEQVAIAKKKSAER